jgi:histidyl-tRNA synthetase
MYGENERKRGLISVKNMATGQQEDLSVNDFIKKLN